MVCTITLMIYAPLLLLVGTVGENCLSYAVRKRLTQGGTILCRRATFWEQVVAPEKRRGWRFWLASQVPHFLWADDQGCVWSYTNKPHVVEQRRREGLFLSWLRLWSYDGHEVRGDRYFGTTWTQETGWLRWDYGAPV